MEGGGESRPGAEKPEAGETERGRLRIRLGSSKPGCERPLEKSRKCKCKEALRALCANSRPGSAAPAELPGTSAPPSPGLRANSLCCHLPGRGGQALAAGAGQGHRGLRGPGPWPCLMEQKTDQQKQGRWGRRRGAGPGVKSGEKP